MTTHPFTVCPDGNAHIPHNNNTMNVNIAISDRLNIIIVIDLELRSVPAETGAAAAEAAAEAAAGLIP
jgi:hypothetical protein